MGIPSWAGTQAVLLDLIISGKCEDGVDEPVLWTLTSLH